MSVIQKVWSGGCAGVDQAAWRTAKALGIPTGGVMPRDFMTHDGPRPHFAELYGAEEDASPSYAIRTEKNVQIADFTLRVATHWNSPGERCTANAIVKHRKPNFDIDVRRERGILVVDQGRLVAAVGALQTLAGRLGRGLVLNVAGNSERTSPGIGDFAQSVVLKSIFGVCT